MKIWNKPDRSGNSADRRLMRRWEEREQVRTTFHEAGHAVVAHALGFTVELISIEPDPKDRKTAGWISITDHLYSHPWNLKRHIVSLTGLIAEQKFDPKVSKRSGSSDNVLNRQYFPAPEGEAENLLSVARLMVDHFWSDISRIANLLLNVGTIWEADFQRSMLTPEYQERLNNSRHFVAPYESNE